jgi:hypothetical protein
MEWLACTNPDTMLRFLWPKKQKRKLALFGVACCRHISRLLVGCINADILEHCRMAKEHVRGCWVVDLILGKK